ncbi:diguanylate cyclase domain-containing protein [Alkalilimnicola sp. S0819]|uniref:diguanylate cyclase domain-containing protein n=1 Tax=Alkalilimnicola sp. S0819 TaxID=2613922 RepID=UPI001261ADA2|nr:diguanylate cyclase [Alkalilimnicola sp. S0819]KAB7623700.1 diguanylate cyclase [Alkalilimnicola sp. S0819]MPQ16829.1 diguanylate cyclase [Alkalilimnicola sp. S0819]
MLHDPLTQLPGRTLFSDRLEQALALAARRKSRAAIIALEAADFDRHFDTQRLSGQALLELSRRIQNDLRLTDSVCRLEGARFLVLLPDVGTVEAVEAVAEELRLHMARELSVEQRRARLVCRAGSAVFPEDGDAERPLVDKALQRLRGQDVAD